VIHQLDSQCFPQIGADDKRHNFPSLSKAKQIENVKEEKGLTGYDTLSDHVFCWFEFVLQIALEKLRSKAAKIIRSQALSVAKIEV